MPPFSAHVLLLAWFAFGQVAPAERERERLTHAARVVTAVAFSPDGTLLATATGDVVHLWDVGNARERRQILGHSGPVTAVRFAPDGRTLASAGLDGTARVWSVADGRETAKLGARAPVNALCFSPDGKSLAGGGRDGTAWIWTLGGGFSALHPQNAEYREVGATAFTADGRRLALGLSDGHVELWQLAPRQFRGWEAGTAGGSVVSLVVSPDGKTLATADRGEQGKVLLWEVVTGRRRTTLGRELCVEQVAFAPDGGWLATGGVDGTVRLWGADGEQQPIGRHDGRVSGLAFSPDGRTLASCGLDGTARLWNVPPSPRTARRAVENAEALAEDLGGEDAARAYLAVRALAAGPDEAVRVLRKRLKPTAPAEKRVARLLAELDDDRFAVREKASDELARLGEAARPALGAALEAGPPLEVRVRITNLLERLAPSAEEVRVLRCVEVLEHAGTAEARWFLKELAAGSPGSLLTREAKASLGRLVAREGKGR